MTRQLQISLINMARVVIPVWCYGLNKDDQNQIINIKGLAR